MYLRLRISGRSGEILEFLWYILRYACVSKRWEGTHVKKTLQPVFARHFGARAACLIVIPIITYMLMFGIHFHSLPNSGEGNGFMSPEFQQTLAGHKLEDTPVGEFAIKLNKFKTN